MGGGGGVQDVRTPTLKFEKCPFYLGYLGGLFNILLLLFFHVMVHCLSWTPPPLI